MKIYKLLKTSDMVHNPALEKLREIINDLYLDMFFDTEENQEHIISRDDLAERTFLSDLLIVKAGQVDEWLVKMGADGIIIDDAEKMEN